MEKVEAIKEEELVKLQDLVKNFNQHQLKIGELEIESTKYCTELARSNRITKVSRRVEKYLWGHNYRYKRRILQEVR